VITAAVIMVVVFLSFVLGAGSGKSSLIAESFRASYPDAIFVDQSPQQ
jgi:hypothetical protein